MWTAIISTVGGLAGGAFNLAAAKDQGNTMRNAANQQGASDRKLYNMLPLFALCLVLAIIMIKK